MDRATENRPSIIGSDRAPRANCSFGSPCLFHADDDPVRMEKILDGRPFAQKLRIRRHSKLRSRIAGIHIQRALQLLSGLRRHRALLNHQLR